MLGSEPSLSGKTGYYRTRKTVSCCQPLVQCRDVFSKHMHIGFKKSCRDWWHWWGGRMSKIISSVKVIFIASNFVNMYIATYWNVYSVPPSQKAIYKFLLFVMSTGLTTVRKVSLHYVGQVQIERVGKLRNGNSPVNSKFIISRFWYLLLQILLPQKCRSPARPYHMERLTAAPWNSHAFYGRCCSSECARKGSALKMLPRFGCQPS